MVTTLSLKDKFILPDGIVVYKESELFRLIKQRIDLTIMNIEKTPETELFLSKSGKALNLTEVADYESTPSADSYNWNLPEKYKNLELLDLCIERLVALNKDNEKYFDRLYAEFEQILLKNMESFLKAIVFVTDIFRKHNIIFGLGRGSSCASLVLYLLDINKVDPVKYDISLTEFFK